VRRQPMAGRRPGDARAEDEEVDPVNRVHCGSV
jgi:hypothetical protein